MRNREMTRRLLEVVAIASAVLAVITAPALAGHRIIVDADGVEPSVLEVLTGERVEFVNQMGRAVHVEFACGAHEHQVVQLPATGPTWAVFNRAGTHPYVVHVYEPTERMLRELIDATGDPTGVGEPVTCAVPDVEICIEL